MPCLKASLSGPIEASFTRFFMSDLEYPVKENYQARKFTFKIQIELQSYSSTVEMLMNLACTACTVDTFSQTAYGLNFLL